MSSLRKITNYGLNDTLIKGSRTLSAKFKYGEVYQYDDNGNQKTRPKLIFTKDTLAMFNCKLSALPAMFHLKVQKELFPYKYYTMDCLDSNISVVNKAGIHEDTP